MITRARALELLDANLQQDALKKHCLASAAIMRALAARFGEPEDDWDVIGLLHDLDFDRTRETPERHARETLTMLASEDIPEAYRHAILAHNEATGEPRSSRLDHALAAAESMTGLVMACALVYPDKQIASVKPKSISKRMNEKAFARNVCRESIMECERIGLSLDDFILLSLDAMKPLQQELIG